MAVRNRATLFILCLSLTLAGCLGLDGPRALTSSPPALQANSDAGGVSPTIGTVLPDAGPTAPSATGSATARAADDVPPPSSNTGTRIAQRGPFPAPAFSSRTPVESSASQIRRLYDRAMERYSTIDSYIARLRRQEQVNGRDKPEELLLFKFRKQPWSVYFKWLGPKSAGREVVYVKGRYGNMIHTLLAAGDMPLVPAGKRMALAPDNIFVRSASRHAITEAGIGYLIDRFGTLVQSPPGAVTYLGRQSRSDVDVPLEAVEQILRPGQESQLPHGGRRLWMFNAEDGLPMLLITTDHTGHQVEYYCYDRLQCPLHLDDSDFNPDQLWPPRREGFSQKFQAR